MATLPKTKKQFMIALKESNISTVEGKPLKKATLAQLKKAYFDANPNMKPQEEAPKKPAKKQSKKEAPKDVPTVNDIANMDSAALLQMAMKVAQEAQKEGEKNKEEITKPTKARKSKWSDVIPLLLASKANQNKDGSYTFTLQDVIDVTGMSTENPKTGKTASWILYSGDWKPTYKGVGSNVLILGYEARVKGAAPSDKAKREAWNFKDHLASWTLTLSPVKIDKQLELMEPRLKGKIKNWVYTQDQYNAVKAQVSE